MMAGQPGSIRKARALGAGAVIAAALLAAPPAMAQGPAGPNIEACQAAHFEHDRYREDLQAAGWLPVAEDHRQAAIAALADAFLPVIETDNPADRAAWRALSLSVLQATAENRLIMVMPGAAVMVTGFEADDGTRRVECWMALQDGALVDGLIDAAEAPDGIDPAEPGYAVYGPVALDERRDFTVVATRHLPLPGMVPAATHGLMTRTDFLTSDRGQSR